MNGILLAIQLTDGFINFSVVDNEHAPTAIGQRGVYHVGFVVDDVADTRRQIEGWNGTYIDDDERVARGLADHASSESPEPAKQRADQRKLQGPDGLKLDIANAEFARISWGIPI